MGIAHIAKQIEMKKAVIFVGHPQLGSFGEQLAAAYVAGLWEAGVETQMVRLATLAFDVTADPRVTELEPDLQWAQDLIRDADHVLFVFPSWWYTFPALLKGFVDRVLTSGFAFRYKESGPFQEKLLTGKTGGVMVTMDAPGWFYRLVHGGPGVRAMTKGTLEFCGIRVIRKRVIGQMRYLKQEQREAALKQAREDGRRDGRR